MDQLELMAQIGTQEGIKARGTEIPELLYVVCPKCGREGPLMIVRRKISDSLKEEVYANYCMARENMEAVKMQGDLRKQAIDWVLVHYGQKGIPITRKFIEDVVNEKEEEGGEDL